ncbi:MAG TPA: ParB/RepB/Spo0J family partition protein [Patescibacteria group bacterium]|nr:ParB/RepB/Spo0J family partition protein [Patescibacteria group bacterium]
MDDPASIHDSTGASVRPIEDLDDLDDISPTIPAAAVTKPQGETAPEEPLGFVMKDSDDETPGDTTGTVQMIPIDRISANPYQPRKFFDPQKLAELAESIKSQGIIQPLVLTRSSDGFEILVGERRYRASLVAGLKFLPAIVRGEISDRAKLELALIENIQREDLNAIEEARAYSRLAEEFGLTQEQIAKKVGKSRPAVANVLRLLNLPAQIQRAVIENKLTEGHGRALLPLENDREKQMEVFNWMLEAGATVRDVENRVREIKNLPLKPYIRSTKAHQPDPEIKQLEDTLREKLGTKVRLQKTGESGKIMIEFYSQDELRSIIERLSQK